MSTPLKNVSNRTPQSYQQSDSKESEGSFYGTIKRQNTQQKGLSFKEAMWQNKYEKMLDEHVKLKEYCEQLSYDQCNNRGLEAQVSHLKALLESKNQEIRDLSVRVNDRLTDLIEIKDAEIEGLIQMNISHKAHIAELCQSVEQLTAQLQKMEEEVRAENALHLKKVQYPLHDQYAQELRSVHDERAQLKNVIELQYQEMYSHQQQLQYQDGQVAELHKQLQGQQQQIQLMQETHQQIIDSFELKLTQLQTALNEATKAQETAEEQNQGLRLEVETWEKYMVSKESEFKLEVDDLRAQLGNQEIEFKSKLGQLQIQKQSLECDVKRTNALVGMKQQECDNLAKQRELHATELKRYKDLTDELRLQHLEYEKMKLGELEDLRKRLEESARYQMENMKSSYQTQISILQEEIKDLEGNRRTAHLRGEGKQSYQG